MSLSEKEHRRLRILKGACSAFLKKGDKATISDIANEASISRGAIGLYFRARTDKAAIAMIREAIAAEGITCEPEKPFFAPPRQNSGGGLIAPSTTHIIYQFYNGRKDAIAACVSRADADARVAELEANAQRQFWPHGPPPRWEIEDVPSCARENGRKANAPFSVGDRVTILHRIPPFLSDDVLVIDEVKNLGTIKSPNWRVRVHVEGRAAQGWLDADNLAKANPAKRPHPSALTKREIKPDGYYTVWLRVGTHWLIERSFKGHYILAEHWPEMVRSWSTTRPVAAFEHGFDPNGAAPMPKRNPPRKSSSLTRAIEFFRKQGMGMKEACDLARAEEYAEEHGWTVDWEYEQDDPEGSFDDGGESAEAIRSGEMEWMTAILRDEEGDVLGSLGAIAFYKGDRAYPRVIEAELALEAMPSKRSNPGRFAIEPDGGNWRVVVDGRTVRRVATRKAAQQFVRLAKRHGLDKIPDAPLLLDGRYQNPSGCRRRNPIELEPDMWAKPEDLEDGRQAYLGHLERKQWGGYTVPLHSIEYAGGSDYSGGTVARSNYKAFEEMVEADESLGEFLVFYYGGHGTYGVAVRLDRGKVPDEILESVGALSQYPLLDEDAHSHLEMELEDEAWSSYGRDDWRRALKKEHPDHEEFIDEMDDDEIDGWYREAAEAANIYPVHEDGGSVYWDFDRAAKETEIEDDEE